LIKYKKLKDLILENKKSNLQVKSSSDLGSYIFFTSGEKTRRSDKKLVAGENIYLATGGKAYVQYYKGDASYSTDCYSITTVKTLIECKYLYYFLISIIDKINEEMFEGTALKHLQKKKLLNCDLLLPPLLIQRKIVAKLDKIFAEIDKAIEVAEANIRNAEALFQSYISNIKATKSTLGDLVTIKTGKLDSNASEKNGKYPFFTCSKEIFSINDYAFDCEAVLLAGNNASGDFNVKHYKGKFNAYQRTYVITIDATDRLTYRYLYFQLINALKKFKSISVGANTKFLRIGMIRTLEFPLPKFDEQIKILKNLSTIEEKKELLKNIYLKKFNLFNIFKQSILQQAFNGELVKVA
jgi:type I restriction enzyme S subunit